MKDKAVEVLMVSSVVFLVVAAVILTIIALPFVMLAMVCETVARIGT